MRKKRLGKVIALVTETQSQQIAVRLHVFLEFCVEIYGGVSLEDLLDLLFIGPLVAQAAWSVRKSHRFPLCDLEQHGVRPFSVGLLLVFDIRRIFLAFIRSEHFSGTLVDDELRVLVDVLVGLILYIGGLPAIFIVVFLYLRDTVHHFAELAVFLVIDLLQFVVQSAVDD